MLVRRKIGWIKYDLRRTVTTEPTSLQRSSSTWWANHRIQHRTLVGGEEADSGFTFRINDAHSASWWTWLQLHFASLCRIIRQYVIFESLNLYISVTGGVVTQVSSNSCDSPTRCCSPPWWFVQAGRKHRCEGMDRPLAGGSFLYHQTPSQMDTYSQKCTPWSPEE